jgi:hypothetical protein
VIVYPTSDLYGDIPQKVDKVHRSCQLATIVRDLLSLMIQIGGSTVESHSDYILHEILMMQLSHKAPSAVYHEDPSSTSSDWRTSPVSEIVNIRWSR